VQANLSDALTGPSLASSSWAWSPMQSPVGRRGGGGRSASLQGSGTANVRTVPGQRHRACIARPQTFAMVRRRPGPPPRPADPVRGGPLTSVASGLQSPVRGFDSRRRLTGVLAEIAGIGSRTRATRRAARVSRGERAGHREESLSGGNEARFRALEGIATACGRYRLVLGGRPARWRRSASVGRRR
jgi:hypothetical protein